MAYFWFLHILAFFHVLPLLRHTMSASIIEPYKPKIKKETKSISDKKLDALSTTLKRLEHKIDDAQVRQRIMEAQMKFPLAFMTRRNRMQPALRGFYNNVPSITYTNSTITTRSGILLQIFCDGTVNGTRDYRSPHAQLTLESVGSWGIYRIKGTKCQKYLVYKKNGRVMAETQSNHANIDESIFRSKEIDGREFYAIESVKHNWFLGFRHNLKIKRGSRVKLRHKESRFIVIARMG